MYCVFRLQLWGQITNCSYSPLQGNIFLDLHGHFEVTNGKNKCCVLLSWLVIADMHLPVKIYLIYHKTSFSFARLSLHHHSVSARVLLAEFTFNCCVSSAIKITPKLLKKICKSLIRSDMTTELCCKLCKVKVVALILLCNSGIDNILHEIEFLFSFCWRNFHYDTSIYMKVNWNIVNSYFPGWNCWGS